MSDEKETTTMAYPTPEDITAQPWHGPCAVTGLTVDEFRTRLAGPAQYADQWPRWVTRAAVAVCRSYNVGGLSDPAYIANVIHGAYLDDIVGCRLVDIVGCRLVDSDAP